MLILSSEYTRTHALAHRDTRTASQPQARRTEQHPPSSNRLPTATSLYLDTSSVHHQVPRNLPYNIHTDSKMVAPPLYTSTTARKLMMVVVMVAAALQLTEAFIAPLVVPKKGPSSASSLKRPAGGVVLPSPSSLTLLTSFSRNGFAGALRRQAEEGEGGEDGGAPPAMESNAAEDSASGGGGAAPRSRKISTGKRKRVRKDRASDTPEETKPKPVDPREQAMQESIITREFDR